MRGEASAISSTSAMPCAVSRMAWNRIGRVRPAFASSWATYWSAKWISHGPSTFGSMMTSSWWPAFRTSSDTSSWNQGEFSGFTRLQKPVPLPCQSYMFAISIAPARAASLASAGMASSRLARMTSTPGAMDGTFARTLSRCGGTKWIIRSSFTGRSRIGSGAPMASGLKKLRGVFCDMFSAPDFWRIRLGPMVQRVKSAFGRDTGRWNDVRDQALL